MSTVAMLDLCVPVNVLCMSMIFVIIMLWCFMYLPDICRLFSSSKVLVLVDHFLNLFSVLVF